jgi:hypothetical protein
MIPRAKARGHAFPDRALSPREHGLDDRGKVRAAEKSISFSDNDRFLHPQPAGKAIASPDLWRSCDGACHILHQAMCKMKSIRGITTMLWAIPGTAFWNSALERCFGTMLGTTLREL